MATMLSDQKVVSSENFSSSTRFSATVTCGLAGCKLLARRRVNYIQDACEYEMLSSTNRTSRIFSLIFDNMPSSS